MATSQNKGGPGNAQAALKRDCYLILKVPPISDNEAVKKAYRDLAKRYHPDLNPDMIKFGEEKMKELKVAYDLVSSLTARKSYDSQPQFQLRIPAEFREAQDFNRKKRKTRKSLWSRIAGLFSGGTPKNGPMTTQMKSQFQMNFSAGLTCAQFPGGKLLSQAEIDFGHALEVKANSVEALYNLGLVLYWQGKFQQAADRFRSVLKFTPGDTAARRMAELLHEDM